LQTRALRRAGPAPVVAGKGAAEVRLLEDREGRLYLQDKAARRPRAARVEVWVVQVEAAELRD
jgi:hypothetical protein